MDLYHKPMKHLLKKSLLTLCAFTSLISCKKEALKMYTNEEIAAESKKVSTFLRKSFENQVSLSPELQTRLGIKTDYGKLDDNTPETENRDLAIHKKELAWLTNSVNIAELSKEVLLSYKL